MVLRHRNDSLKAGTRLREQRYEKVTKRLMSGYSTILNGSALDFRCGIGQKARGNPEGGRDAVVRGGRLGGASGSSGPWAGSRNVGLAAHQAARGRHAPAAGRDPPATQRAAAAA